jgi:hypothetical protein
MTMTTRRTLRLTALAGVMALVAAVVSCGGEEMAQPNPVDPSVASAVDVTGDAAVTMTVGGDRLDIRTGVMRVLDAGGAELASLPMATDGYQATETGAVFAGAWPGVDLHLYEADGALRRLVRVAGPLVLPAGAVTVEFVETMDLPAGLTVLTEAGIPAVGETVVTGAAFDLRGPDDDIRFHVPAAAGWNAAGRDYPWMAYRLTRTDTDRLEVGTRASAAWLTDPDARYPLTVDPTVTPGAPEPVIGSIFVSPTAPGSRVVSLAATYSNFYLDSLEVRIDWGDGDSDVLVTVDPVQRLHVYAVGADSATVGLQVSDFTVDAQGNPMPRTVRHEQTVVLGELDTEPQQGCAGFTRYDQMQLAWSGDGNAGSSGGALDMPAGVPLGFTLEIEGQQFTHVNQRPDGFIELLDGQQTTSDAMSGRGISSFLRDHRDRSFVFALLDDLDPAAGGYYGFQHLADRVVFYWDAPAAADAAGDCTNRFLLTITAAGEIHYGFDETGCGGHDHDLFTGMYLADWNNGTAVAVHQNSVPTGQCWTYPGCGMPWNPR